VGLLLASRIAAVLDIPHVEIDVLCRGRNWTPRPSFAEMRRTPPSAHRRSPQHRPYRCSTMLTSRNTRESVKHHPEPPTGIRRNHVYCQPEPDCRRSPGAIQGSARPAGIEPATVGLEACRTTPTRPSTCCFACSRSAWSCWSCPDHRRFLSRFLSRGAGITWRLAGVEVAVSGGRRDGRRVRRARSRPGGRATRRGRG
jgi:hypothetical protein